MYTHTYFAPEYIMCASYQFNWPPACFLVYKYCKQFAIKAFVRAIAIRIFNILGRQNKLFIYMFVCNELGVLYS